MSDKPNPLVPPRNGKPAARPRDAASLILVDHRDGQPHVLMGRRDPALKFLPGVFVFPGGRVDRRDHHAPFAADLHEATASRLLLDMKRKPSARRARGLALAAIRETYEESGLLIGRPGSAARRPPGMWDAFCGYGVLPDLSRLTYFARAITPPHSPKRFDTRFFAATADSIAHTIDFDQRPDQELDQLQWVPISELASIKTVPITLWVLDDLKAMLKRNGMLQPASPVAYYRPFSNKRRVMLDLPEPPAK